MNRYILTGAPGSGKTLALRQLELEGFAVVEEAATDVIALQQALGKAEPWMRPEFVDDVARLQKLRQMQSGHGDAKLQIHDRSVICTAALAEYLRYPISHFLSTEIERVLAGNVFEKKVFFLRNLGFITPTEARRISFEETVRFEKIHEQAYARFGFEIIFIEAAPLLDRVCAIVKAVQGAT